jgi:hypothetical protein
MEVGIQMVAKVLHLDMVPFRASVSALEDFQIQVRSGSFNTDINPSALGKITLALRDMRMAARELIADARHLRIPESATNEAIAYGSDLGVIVGSMVIIAKALRMSPQIFIKARNEVFTFFNVMSSSIPEAASAESVVLAARVRKASIIAKTDPERAEAWLDALHGSISEVTR